MPVLRADHVCDLPHQGDSCKCDVHHPHLVREFARGFARRRLAVGDGVNPLVAQPPLRPDNLTTLTAIP